LKKLSDITIVKLRKNSGQSSALDAGLKQAKGEIIITMDGDGQDDPSEIPTLLAKLDGGYDVVCAWRKKRADSLSKRVVSLGARYLRSILVDDGVHDAGTQFRIYRKECFEDLDLYGEMHRMIPALLKWRGFRVGEVPVHHRARKHGVTKYTTTRIVKGLLDMVYIWFWRKYSQRPLHLFGSLGTLFFIAGSVILTLMLYAKLFWNYALSDKIWPLVGFFFILVGIQLMIAGLQSAHMVEMTIKKRYYVKDVIHT
jgi:glycosyltransferase involved in cell wall biosynthesis